MQVGYVKNAKNLEPIILDSSKYKEAANYSIEKEKISIVSSFYEFVIFLMWIGFGLSALDSVVTTTNPWLKAVIFIDLFIIINWILTLPFDIYSTFKLDKKYGFSNMTVDLYIKDTIKTGALFLILGSIVIAGIAFIIESFPAWWIWGFVFIFGIHVVNFTWFSEWLNEWLRDIEKAVI
mgnify:CR=1 FL=1